MTSETSSHELMEKDEVTPPHTGDASTIGDYPMAFIDQVDVKTLTRIATQRSRRQSTLGTTDNLTVLAQQDPSLDPQSGNFDLHKWLKAAFNDLNRDGRSGHTSDVIFKQLNVYGSGAALQFQDTVTSILTTPFRVPQIIRESHSPQRRILKDFNGLLRSGELLLVLGRPGAGCSTLLKSMTGELHGLKLDKESVIHYNGIPQPRMMKEFKGELVYNQEVDRHFPHLTVGQTLEFAAATRTPAHRFQGMSRAEYAKYLAQIIMAVFGLSHTYNTRVGDDFIRGVSGGERKRVSIAEMALAHAPIAAWDNSTRGLDSATALKFVEALRLSSDITGSCHAVAIYQASQSIYDVFDKVIVLYEGHQIFFGPAAAAKSYFENQGWDCPTRQTTGDFLTSITNPQERTAKPGMENRVPRTPEDFEAAWLKSPEYKQLLNETAEYEGQNPVGYDVQAVADLQQWKRGAQAKHTRPKSPYIISVPMQIKLNTVRAYQRLWNNAAATISTVVTNIIMALIVGSVFYGTPDATAGFTSKGATLFFAVLLNALTAMSEINSLYSQRPIVEKHNSFAFYHPATEAIAGVLSDVPVKFAMAVVFNIILYFLAGLKREASNFFLYFLITFIITFVMSAVFRTLAAVTKTISQAMGLAGVMILILVVYTGFVLPVPSMHPWFKWLHYLNPIYYAFEILIANEFHAREFPCSSFVPSYADLSGKAFSCTAAGSTAGSTTVNGDRYIELNYTYSYSHVWRNFGILIAFLIGFMLIYFAATEINSATTSTAEALVFRRGHEPARFRKGNRSGSDVESTEPSKSQPTADTDDKGMGAMQAQTDTFTWRNVCYDIEIKGEPRRLLDNVSGWVKPGTLTALMGVSGAGKTTLLDVLAHRTSMGVITGDMFVNGHELDQSFQRKTGYVQQQDLHLDTSTVRESLRFSAMLRQPASVSVKEKYDYVEDVIKMLKMEEFAEAIVGVPGEGLNVEQRKLLTIGVELAAKPNGLDSQSSWAICSFLRKLAEHGQAVLCTIHQPSAMLFQQFDQLLFLARGGKTVYFGPVGENSSTMLKYFESNGARKCDDRENPAEYMLGIVNAGKNDKGQDWFDVWKQSNESRQVQTELDRIHKEKGNESSAVGDSSQGHSEFAMPFWFQINQVMYRVFQQYWRMPSYILAKWGLGVVSGLFIGFSFYGAKTSLQGMQTVIYSLFMICTIFSSLAQQIMPVFVSQRSLYEGRERPSKSYSWKAFLIANIVVEIPFMVVMGVLTYASYFYAVVGIPDSLTQGTVLLFCIVFFIYASTFTHMVIAGLPDETTASAVVVLLFAMSLMFCGVMQTPSALPGFWIFMYRVSPFTYWVGGMASTQLHNRQVVCSTSELAIFDPPSGQTCGQYLMKYVTAAGGQLLNPEATSDCSYCSLKVADQYLSTAGIFYSERWRNFGIMWAFIAFNVFIATIMYYLIRVKRWSSADMKESVMKLIPGKKSKGDN
ncbi:ABC multidrug transporter, putative [Penicillium digitatum PHI26]|uniref:ABC multidrug transporter, putative n=2 Tax=Penicillium digitatum TaxID=36651 RepID=K9FSZ3_PEND2|nr:ABC multidrug transporter, putative [Penicillium digitatum Pd1]EKV04206.1 ABC multidrug transporter, putative [Penicillium digitatum PHI26]EKV21333.1 ABC multidrug transporter, putative [Penicillium digitatum Pd1]